MVGVGAGGAYYTGRGVRVSGCTCEFILGTGADAWRYIDGEGGAGWGTDGTWLYTGHVPEGSGLEQQLVRIQLLDATNIEVLYDTGGNVGPAENVEVRSCCIDDDGFIYWIEQDRAVVGGDLHETYTLRKRLIAGGSITDLYSEASVLNLTGKQFDGIAFSASDGMLYAIRCDAAPNTDPAYTTELVRIDPGSGSVTSLYSFVGPSVADGTAHFFEHWAICPTPDGAVWAFLYEQDESADLIFRYDIGAATGAYVAGTIVDQFIPQKDGSVLVLDKVVDSFPLSWMRVSPALVLTPVVCPSSINVSGITWAATHDLSVRVYVVHDFDGIGASSLGYNMHAPCGDPITAP